MDAQMALPDAAPGFAARHIGADADATQTMLAAIGLPSLDALIDQTIPPDIRIAALPAALPEALEEAAAMAELQALAAQNQQVKSLLGTGYHGTLTPAVIQRNLLENPSWYTAYTPYQPEISQGRLEALLVFQTMIAELTGMPIANASLLDEATALAEAASMAHAVQRGDGATLLLADDLHPQSRAVLAGRAVPLGWAMQDFAPGDVAAIAAACPFAVVLQYPGTTGALRDLRAEIAAAQQAGALAIVAADLLGLVVLTPPGQMGADIVVGSAQRFGVPLGFGGPHAGYFATRDTYRRHLPGRLVGLARDAAGAPALRLALQTREQHIRREKATSNICTAQVLLAIMAACYAVWHGPEGLARIARRVATQAVALAQAARAGGWALGDGAFFDSITIRRPAADCAALLEDALAAGFNLRRLDATTIGISLDETVTEAELGQLCALLGGGVAGFAPGLGIPPGLHRDGPALTHPIFAAHHAEHAFLRWLKRLEDKDISLTRSMIPLGSCTMKLNAAAEMAAISLPGFAAIHPFAPPAQTQGYAMLTARLAAWLCAATGFAAASLQPNAGSQGEYAGLLVIRAYHAARKEPHRNICLIPSSAHGTNPASAVLAGMQVVEIACDAAGNVDLDDLRAKSTRHAGALAALMVTYPSTHGVFEPAIREICGIVHAAGGQVYMDGANMNAQIGLTSPAAIGADICHLNLHKTFCIPHGGGGPGVGPICAAAHLAPFLPTHPARPECGPPTGIAPVSAAPYGSALILPISYAYIRMMGANGLRQASRIAILNANYIAARLGPHYPILFTNEWGRVAHECILDCRMFQASAGIRVEDIAKRLQDYGYHAPTMSWPVPGTLMIEPTESETLDEIDRFCDAMISIREEIAAIANGTLDRTDNPLRNAPHTAAEATADDWPHPYKRRLACYPLPWLHQAKYWPPVKRVDNAYGDRNLVCACPPVSAFADG